MSETAHIAIFAFPFGSHAAALFNYAQRLAASAPAGVSFSFFSTPTSNNKIFSKSNHSIVQPFDVSDGILSEESPPAAPNPVDTFLKAIPHNYQKSLVKAEEQTGVKVNCLLADAFLWFAGDMAAEMGVPWVAFWVAGASSLSSHVHSDLIRASTNNFKNISLEILPGLSQFSISDFPEGVVMDLETPVAEMLYTMGLKLPKAVAIVLNSFEEIEPVSTNDLKMIFNNVLNIGPSTITVPPLMKSDDPNGCITWLDKHKAKSVVYIGFGTVLVPPPNEILELAEALHVTKIPFIWSLPDEAKRLLPNHFQKKTIEQGKIVAWAPQLHVLAHQSVGVNVTHCGYNSVMESVLCGVVIIGRPLLGDNKMNCRLVEEVWKIGVKAEGGTFTKSGTINALNSTMFGESGKEMRQNLGIIRGRLLQSVGPNGSSTLNFKRFSDLLLNPLSD